MKKKIVPAILASSLLLPSSITFAQDTKTNSNNTNDKIVSAKFINEFTKENDLPPVSESDIPTVDELREATEGLMATEENPVVTKDLGNGFGVTLWVDEAQTDTPAPIQEQNQGYKRALSTVAATSQNKTATGGIEYTFLGISWWRLGASVNFNYNGQKITKVNSYDVIASGAPGYSVSNKKAKLADIDPSAKDIVVNADFKYAKFVAESTGHAELRFTGTGNYYIHNSLWK